MADNETSSHAYWETVRLLADECVERDAQGRDVADMHEDGADDIAQRAVDYVPEACDGNWWTIYYHAAREALKHSDNEDAIFESGCFDASTVDSVGAFHCLAASFALAADVQEAIHDAAERWLAANPCPTTEE